MPDHKRDAARAEDALTLSYGSELIGMQRDWNEELQSCREFPHTTPQERYLISYPLTCYIDTHPFGLIILFDVSFFYMVSTVSTPYESKFVSGFCGTGLSTK